MENQTPGQTFQKPAFIKAPPTCMGLYQGLLFSCFCHYKSVIYPVNFPWPIHVVFGARIVWFYNNSYSLLKLKSLRVAPGLRDMKGYTITLW